MIRFFHSHIKRVEEKRDLIKNMTMVVWENVKHYYSDFTCYDIPYLLNTDKSFLWFIKNTGTLLIPMEMFNNKYFNIVAKMSELAFLVKPATGELIPFALVSKGGQYTLTDEIKKELEI